MSAPTKPCVSSDAVRGGDDDDLAPRFEAVHHRQELGDDPALHLAGHVLTLGCDGVEFVDEDDRRRLVFGVLEDLAQLLFGLAVVLRDDLRPRDGEEGRGGFVGDGLREEGLPGPRRAVEEDTLWGFDP